MRRFLLAVVLLSACTGDGQRAETAPSPAPPAVTTVAPAGVPPSSVATVPGAETTTAGAVGSRPVGFELTPARITLADGTVCELCLWRAATPAQRRRGLMGVTELGPADGMVFVYDAPSTSPFWMRGTPMPLSIAWFDARGRFVSAAEMEPCLDGPAAGCARYPAAGPYLAAVELPAGRVAALGVGAGTTLALGAGEGCGSAG